MRFRFSLQYKCMITAAGAVFLVGLCAALFGWLNMRVGGLQLRLTNIQERTEALSEERESAKRICNLFAERHEDVARINNFFVDEKSPITFIEALEELGRTTRNLVTIDLDQAFSKDGLLGFRLNVEGSEESLLRYLSAVELMPYEITVEEWSFRRGAGSAESSAGSLSSQNAALHRLTVTLRVRARS